MIKQKDIIYINFDPARGSEIRKTRPALVVSANNYNRATRFLIVCPITSKIRNLATYFTLDSKNYKTHGQIVTHQIYSLDATAQGGRHPEYVETLRDEDFYIVQQLVGASLGLGLN